MTDGPKRFYKDVSLAERKDGFAVALDGRLARTAGRAELVAPKALAEALRAEWDAQSGTISMETMPLTRLHGFVLDAGEEGRAEFIDTIVQYAGSDLLCYRASDRDLAARQEQLFRPFLDRASDEGMTFTMTEGIVPVTQARATIDRVRAWLEDRPTLEVFPRKLLTEITGSAILALYADQDPENAFAAARLDEAFQAEKWGLDAEAEARERALRRDFDDVLRYLALSRG
ncbi:ATP12 family chaperone protein [Parvularcula lutaonensis]|uniref:ATP12 family chaperone protein n=1 Tax=Parvularcula lutaonensis TaxID=491923 RepID=A0ABV7M9M9_9PROT|nr:ATP12 family protein [Parvularcula lutaonensis]GGY42914.1 ATPase [Parvularcula lutaonensis]